MANPEEPLEQDPDTPDGYLYDVDSLDRDPTPTELAEQKPTEPPKPPSKFSKLAGVSKKVRNSILVVTAFAVYVVLFSLSSGVVKINTPGSAKNASAASLDYGTTSIPASSVKVKNALDEPLQKLAINGELKVTNGLVLTPSDKPTNPTPGAMYLDAATKRINYYDGTKFVDIGAPAITITNVTNSPNITNVTNVSESPTITNVTYVTNSPITNVTNVTNNQTDVTNNNNYTTNVTNVTNITTIDNSVINNVTNITNEITNITNVINQLPDLSGYNQLLARVAYLDGSGPQTFTGNNKFTGTVLLQNTVNSARALEVQTAAGNSLLLVDTLNTTIDVGSTKNAVAQTVNIGSNEISGSNTTVNIGSTQGDSQVKIASGTKGVLVKGADSTTAFAVQNSAGDNKFVVDTVHSEVNVTGTLNIVPVVGTQVGGTLSSVESPLILGANTFAKKRDIVITNNDASVLPANAEVTVAFNPTDSAEIFASTRFDQNDFRFSYNGLEIARNITSYTASNITFKFIIKTSINPGAQDTYSLFYSSPGISTPGPNYALTQIDSVDTPWVASGPGITTVADPVIRKEGAGSMRFTGTAIQVPSPAALNQGVLPEGLSFFGTVNATVNGSQYVYSAGGYNRANAAVRSTVARASVDANGNIGNFTTVGQGQLPVGRYTHKVLVDKNGSSQYIYVIGGHDGTSYKGEIYKALIDPSTGNAGAFTQTSILPIGIGYEEAFTETIGLNRYMYVLGGNADAGVQNAVYRAQIDSSGNVGAFTQVGALPVNTYAFGAFSASANGQKSVYVIGGSDGTSARSNVYRAIIDVNGNVGSFSTAGQGQLPAGRYGFTTNLVAENGGQQIIVGGGFDGSVRLTSVLQASIDNDGNITSFTTQDQGSLPTAISYHASVVTSSATNKFINFLGGDDGDSVSAQVCDKVCIPGNPIITSTATINHAQIGKIATYNARKDRAPIDLSTYPFLRFWVSASRAGSYMSFEISGDNGSTWLSYPLTIATGNTWEEKEIQISGPDLAHVTNFRLKVNDTSVNVTGYLDDLRAGNEFAVPFTGIAPTTAAQDVIKVSSNLTVNSTGEGKVVIQYGTGGSGGFTVYDGGTFAYFDVSKKGEILSRRKVDSATAFAIQNAAGVTLFNANTSKMEITVNGHLVSAGDTPTAAPASNAGVGSACTINGNDTAGTITITTGNALWQSGTQCTITFKSAFGAAPRSTITPTSSNTAARQPYLNSTTTTLSIKFNVADTSANTYTFNYFNAQ